MFSKRRARREQERQQDLSERIRSTEADVRVAAAAEIVKVRDQEWALRELAKAVDREPSPAAFAYTAGYFCDALGRERAVRERVEQMLVRHDDDPAALARAWTTFMAEYGADTALERVGEDLAEEISDLIRSLYEQGSRHHELPSMRPDSFAYEFTFARVVMGLLGTVRRSAPLSPEEAEQAREEVRAALERALAQPPDSDERRAVLVPLAMPPEGESWTERALLALRVEEALALCRSAEPERVTLGVEVLHTLTVFNCVPRHPAIREALDRLCVTGQDPYTLGVGLLCYAALHTDRPLDDPPAELFLASLRHPDAVVRAAAASGLGDVGQGLPQKTHLIAALTKVLDGDSDLEVTRCAASALATLRFADETDSRAASKALARYADSSDACLRAASLEGALLRDEPTAFGRLTTELERVDVETVFVSVAQVFAGKRKSHLADGERAELTRLLERLRDHGWTVLPSSGDEPNAGGRARVLDDTLKTLRTSAR